MNGKGSPDAWSNHCVCGGVHIPLNKYLDQKICVSSFLKDVVELTVNIVKQLL